MIADTEAIFDEMHAIVDGLEAGDLEGIAKEDVKAALVAYEDTVIVVQNQAKEVADLYLAGKPEASANANNGATKNLEALGAAETAFMDMIKICSDNLIEQKRQNVDGYASISDSMFFVFLGAAIIMIIYVNKTIASPAKKASGHLNQIIEKIDKNEGDLTERIEVKTKDEVGQLVTGVNGFIEQLQGIMVKIRNESTHMNELVGNITKGINDSNENASNISATMEELSASMEEVAATLDEILQNFYASAENLRTTMATMADGIDGINIAVDESAQGVALAAQNTGSLVEALESIRDEADVNLEISENLQGEVSRFKNI